jgi:hypothetical protein
MLARVLPGVVSLLLSLLAVPAAASAPAAVVRLAPAEDVSLPFQCDWGYDWDERCYHDDSDRLPIGGDVDAVWRAALRFSLASLPSGAGVQEALLGVYHDGTCLGTRGAVRRCAARPFTVEAHAIVDPDWTHEREVAFDPTPLARATLSDPRAPGWLILDVSELVAAWAAGEAPVAGIVLQLPVAEERLGGSGPKPASSSFPVASQRPWLEVAYIPPVPDPRPG